MEGRHVLVCSSVLLSVGTINPNIVFNTHIRIMYLVMYFITTHLLMQPSLHCLHILSLI